MWFFFVPSGQTTCNFEEILNFYKYIQSFRLDTNIKQIGDDSVSVGDSDQNSNITTIDIHPSLSEQALEAKLNKELVQSAVSLDSLLSNQSLFEKMNIPFTAKVQMALLNSRVSVLCVCWLPETLISLVIRSTIFPTPLAHTKTSCWHWKLMSIFSTLSFAP